MNGSHKHGLFSFSLVIIHDLNHRGAGISIWPHEANSPLLIDANGVLPRPVALEGFETIARQGAQRSQVRRGIEDGQTLRRLIFKALERLDELPAREGFCLFVSIAQDHLTPS